jgi:CheY-like chemotaxis protein
VIKEPGPGSFFHLQNVHGLVSSSRLNFCFVSLARLPHGRHNSKMNRRSNLAPGRFRMLVVDDNPLSRMGLAATIRKMDGVGLVETAGDGREALQMVAKMQPHLVILDLEMPGMNGIEFLREVAAYRDVRCIVYSSLDADCATARLSLRLGAIGYFTKGAELNSHVLSQVMEEAG